MRLFERIKSRRARRKLAELEERATLSPAERAEIDALRTEHSAGRGMSFGAPGVSDRNMKWPDH